MLKISSDSVLDSTPSLGPLAKRVEYGTSPAFPDRPHGHIIWRNVEFGCLRARAVLQREIPCIAGALCGEEIFYAAAGEVSAGLGIEQVGGAHTRTWNGRCFPELLSPASEIPSQAAGRQGAGSRRLASHSQLDQCLRGGVVTFHLGPVEQGSSRSATGVRHAEDLEACDSPRRRPCARTHLPDRRIRRPSERMRWWRAAAAANAGIDDGWWLGGERMGAGPGIQLTVDCDDAPPILRSAAPCRMPANSLTRPHFTPFCSSCRRSVAIRIRVNEDHATQRR